MANSTHRVAIAGVGYSQVGRKLLLSDDELVRQAITAAMDDAGMRPADIDGIGTMGGNSMHMGHLLGIMPLNYFFTSSLMAAAFVEPAIMSISAVASGLSHACVAVRLIRQQGGANASPRVGEDPGSRRRRGRQGTSNSRFPSAPLRPGRPLERSRCSAT